SKTSNIVFSLCTNTVEKLRMSGIHAASKHEVLPDENSQLVTKFVKVVVLINSTTPNTKHVHVCIGSRLEQPSIMFFRYSRRETIGWNPVGAFSKDRNAIHYEAKALAPFIALLPHFK